MATTKPVAFNLFAGPGSGKSTTAAGLFFIMKCMGMKVELVTEYAKDLVYDGSLNGTASQQYEIFYEQSARMKRLIGKVDYIITDSPILMQFMYGERAPGMREEYPNYLNDIKSVMRDFTNRDYLIERVKPYHAYGRVHDEQEARDLDRDVRRLLLRAESTAIPIVGDWSAPFKIFKEYFGVLPEQYHLPIKPQAQVCSIYEPECEACQ